MTRPDELHRNFGLALRELRLKAALSQEALAESSGLSRNYVSELEHGLKSPSLRVIAALSATLGKEPHELVRKAERGVS